MHSSIFTRGWALVSAALIALAAPGALAQQVYGIGTNPQGSAYYAVGVAIAKIAQDATGQQFRIQPSGGTNVYVPQVNRGELEFGLSSVQDLEYAVRGVETYAGKPNADIRMISAMFPLLLGLAVIADLPIQRIADMRGARASADFPAQIAVLHNQEAMLATGGLTMRDMVRVPVPNQIKAAEGLADNRLDVALMVPNQAIARETHLKLQSRGGIRFIPIDDSPQSVAAMKGVVRRSYLTALEPGPAFVGIPAPIKTMTISAYIFTNKGIADELVYKIAKALHANKAELAKSTPILGGFDPTYMAEAHEVPYHLGVEKFYREIGQWPPRER